MGLYALEEENLETVFAAEAIERKTYFCSGCKQPVKVRKGRYRLPHFYHLRQSPSCRLYSKSEDHLLAQLALKQLLPPGEVTLEKSFAQIIRVADVAWETRQIAFEIQCSKLSPYEVAQRVRDYQEVGYHVVWILDDRIFNRRRADPAERSIRQTLSYYMAIRHQSSPWIYDQFEVIDEGVRLHRGRHLTVSLERPLPIPQRDWEVEDFPQQVIQKVAQCPFHFQGDLLHKAVLSAAVPALFFSMQNLRFLELSSLALARKREGWVVKLVRKCLLEPFGALTIHLLEWAAK